MNGVEGDDRFPSDPFDSSDPGGERIQAALLGEPSPGGLGFLQGTLIGIGAALLGALGWFLWLLLARRRREGPPGPPSNLAAADEDTLVRFTWDAPTEGGPAEAYTLEGTTDAREQPDDATAWEDVVTIDVGDPDKPGVLALPARQAEGITAWRVRGNNEHGDGEPSEWARTEQPNDDDTALIGVAPRGSRRRHPDERRRRVGDGPRSLAAVVCRGGPCARGGIPIRVSSSGCPHTPGQPGRRSWSGPGRRIRRA